MARLEPSSATVAVARAAHHLANDVQLFEVTHEALSLRTLGMPKNSLKNYLPKQQEWEQWCLRTKAFEDGVIVTQNKLILFLKEQVFDRRLRTKQGRQPRLVNGEQVFRTLNYSSVQGYVSAIVQLYAEQRTRGINSHPNPRGEALKALLDHRVRREHSRRKMQYEDRGVASFQDGFQAEWVPKIVQAGWQCTAASSLSTLTAQLRTSVDFLFGYMLLYRGEVRRMIELADLSYVEFPLQGPTPCWGLVILSQSGKVNQFGKRMFMGVVRHKDLLRCTISQLAFYFFLRWNVVREAPPTFQRRQDWYGIKMLTRDKTNRTEELSYETQLKWTSTLFRSAGLESVRKTHAGRMNGAKNAELAGVSEEQIRRAGRWNNDALTNCYLPQLPLSFIRNMAGFRTSQETADYYIARARVEPPEALRRTLWPWVDDWLSWFQERRGGASPQARTEYQHIELQDLPAADEDVQDLAAAGFLRILDMLRTVLLQDAALLQEHHPHHPIWNDALFQHPEFAAFAVKVRVSVQNAEEPYEVRLQQVVPDIATSLSTLRTALYEQVQIAEQNHVRNIREMKTQFDRLLSSPLTLHFGSAPLATPLPTARTATTASWQRASPPYEDAVSRQSAMGEELDDHEPASAPLRSYTLAECSSYVMQRWIETVPDLWQEWNEGVLGFPALREIEATYGPSWRPSQAERMFFGRRRTILTEIERRTRLGGTGNVADAVDQLEAWRVRERLSLHGLSQRLKK